LDVLRTDCLVVGPVSWTNARISTRKPGWERRSSSVKKPVTDGRVSLIQPFTVDRLEVQSAKLESVLGMLVPVPAKSTLPSSFQSPGDRLSA